MQKNTKTKRTFGEWLDKNGGRIIVGTTVIGFGVMNVIYAKHCKNVSDTYNETMAAMKDAVVNRINALECKECIKTVVTEFTGE